MAVQGIDLVSDTTVKELVEQIKYGNALRAAEAADSLATLKGDFKGIQSLVRNGLASKVFAAGRPDRSTVDGQRQRETISSTYGYCTFWRRHIKRRRSSTGHVSAVALRYTVWRYV